MNTTYLTTSPLSPRTSRPTPLHTTPHNTTQHHSTIPPRSHHPTVNYINTLIHIDGMRTQSPIVYVVILIVLWGVNADWNFQSQRGVPELKEWHFLGPFTVGKTEVDGGMSHLYLTSASHYFYLCFLIISFVLTYFLKIH